MVANIARTTAKYAVKTFGKAAGTTAKAAAKAAGGAMEAEKAIEATVKSGKNVYNGMKVFDGATGKTMTLQPFGEAGGLWNKPFTEMNYSAFKKLEADRQTLFHIVREAQQQVSPKLVNAVHSFTDCVYSGLRQIKTRPNMKFISIGQSPAVVAEALSVRGVDTAILPLSKLAGLGEKDLKVLAKSEKFAEYLKKLKKYGIDFANMKKDTDYIFVDYTSSGQSLKNFRQLLELSGHSGENVRFMSLQEIVAEGLKTGQHDKAFIERFMKHKIHECRFKKNFSPIVKLPVSEIEKLPEVKELPKKPLLEKLKLLLFNRNSAKPV